MIIIESKKKNKERLGNDYPGAVILDVTSKSENKWIYLSPFYPHGSIPVPFSPEWMAESVEGIWQGLKVFEKKFHVVVQGNLAKFGQNPTLRKYLLSTGQRILVEASPFDRIWGIGMREEDKDVQKPERWFGTNLLGFALMVVRDELARI